MEHCSLGFESISCNWGPGIRKHARFASSGGNGRGLHVPHSDVTPSIKGDVGALVHQSIMVGALVHPPNFHFRAASDKK